jgi:RNA polymerase sigma factor (sigma-70 family)
MSSSVTSAGRLDLSHLPDAELIEMTRAGAIAGYAELWRRHHSVAVGAARRATTTFDPDDLVAEAFAAVLTAIRGGGGPVDTFRAYLCATVRNLARRWGAARREITVDELPEPDRGDEVLGQEIGRLDDRFVREAFAALPVRWRDVLLCTEVEQLGTNETAARLGLTPNATAVLAFRAREGLRRAWLQAHVAASLQEGECAWALAHVGEHSRDGLQSRAAGRMDAHLATCRSCRDVALEVGQVDRRLTRALLPLLLAGGSLAAWFASPTIPVAAAGLGATIAACAAALFVVAGLGVLQLDSWDGADDHGTTTTIDEPMVGPADPPGSPAGSDAPIIQLPQAPVVPSGAAGWVASLDAETRRASAATFGAVTDVVTELLEIDLSGSAGLVRDDALDLGIDLGSSALLSVDLGAPMDPLRKVLP